MKLDELKIYLDNIGYLEKDVEEGDDFQLLYESDNYIFGANSYLKYVEEEKKFEFDDIIILIMNKTTRNFDRVWGKDFDKYPKSGLLA